jgi:hypothetical protein
MLGTRPEVLAPRGGKTSTRRGASLGAHNLWARVDASAPDGARGGRVWSPSKACFASQPLSLARLVPPCAAPTSGPSQGEGPARTSGRGDARGDDPASRRGAVRPARGMLPLRGSDDPPENDLK